MGVRVRKKRVTTKTFAKRAAKNVKWKPTKAIRSRASIETAYPGGCVGEDASVPPRPTYNPKTHMLVRRTLVKRVLFQGGYWIDMLQSLGMVDGKGKVKP